MNYLNRKAEKWVSNFVLIGCAAITLSLGYVSYQAQAIGSHYNDKGDRDVLNSLLQD